MCTMLKIFHILQKTMVKQRFSALERTLSVGEARLFTASYNTWYTIGTQWTMLNEWVKGDMQGWGEIVSLQYINQFL